MRGSVGGMSQQSLAPQSEASPPNSPEIPGSPSTLARVAFVVLLFLAWVGWGPFKEYIRSYLPLSGVALSRLGQSIQVCTREDLHDCVVRTGLPGGRERTQGPFARIGAVASCDALFTEANTACPAGSSPTCLVERGVVLADVDGLTRLSDPRDGPSSVNDRSVRVECREGTMEGHWNEPNY